MRFYSAPFTFLALTLCSCGSSGSGSSDNGDDGLAGASSTGGSDGAGGDGSGGDASGGAATTGGNGGTGGTPPCTDDQDCTGADAGVCDAESGACVKCTAENDTCTDGSYCDPQTNDCVTGCGDAADCAQDPNGQLVCNVTTHGCVSCLESNDCAQNPDGNTVCDTATPNCVECLGSEDCAADMNGNLVCDAANQRCVACVADDDCAAGKVCAGNECVDGCTATHACAGSDECCNGACVDLGTNLSNCGTCDFACVAGDNATTECVDKACEDTCLVGFADCNGDPADGCEWDTTAGGECVCEPGMVRSCYDGADGTQNNAPCQGGQQTCEPSGLAWGSCVGQVLPQFDACSNDVDDDCDGVTDNTPDQDGDGWTICEGDCCETNADCVAPELVNPGAYEFANGIDDDCDLAIDNATTSCSTTAKYTSVLPIDVARAADLCQTTTASPPKAQKKWGVISASYLNVDGSAPTQQRLTTMTSSQSAVATLFGSTIVSRKYATFGGLSTGMMRDASDAGWVLPVQGTDFTSQGSAQYQFTGLGGPLGAYLAQHTNSLVPGTCQTTTCATGTNAGDTIDLRLVVRVPTNANSFSFDHRFFSAEYQTYQCTQFNDHFLALLTSGATGIPADHNIAADVDGRPISVNSSFFTTCGGNGKNCGPCSSGTSGLAGTGFDQVNGGATQWLTTKAPVVPGETITLDIMVFDVQDRIYDSLVLLDAFTWSTEQLATSSTQ